MSFLHRIPVRFDDVDYARILYYPRAFTFCQHAFEAFCEAELGASLRSLIDERRLGFPIVHTEADYSAPLQYGDECQVQLEVERLSERSVSFRYQLWRKGTTLCVRAKIVQAVVDLTTFQACPLPDDLRARLERHLIAAG
jgi:YbgC/YbaW family acyl-CoA thioester hydrolase